MAYYSDVKHATDDELDRRINRWMGMKQRLLITCWLLAAFITFIVVVEVGLVAGAAVAPFVALIATLFIPLLCEYGAEDWRRERTQRLERKAKELGL